MPIDCQRNSQTFINSQRVISVGINAARPRRKKRRKSWEKLSRKKPSREECAAAITAGAAPEVGWSGLLAATDRAGVAPLPGGGFGSLKFTTTSIPQSGYRTNLHAQNAKINR